MNDRGPATQRIAPGADSIQVEALVCGKRQAMRFNPKTKIGCAKRALVAAAGFATPHPNGLGWIPEPSLEFEKFWILDHSDGHPLLEGAPVEGLIGMHVLITRTDKR